MWDVFKELETSIDKVDKYWPGAPMSHLLLLLLESFADDATSTCIFVSHQQKMTFLQS